jgi:DNA-3-methyladenine glycosylase
MNPDAALPARRLHVGRVLPPAFYDRDTELVARALLGCVLQCATAEGTAAGMIVETEAYLGEHDPACHAAVGRTSRTQPLYGPPGTAYVYFIYGMYWCVNAVTRAEGLPSAVLIRALEPVAGVELMCRRRPRARSSVDLCNGPGKLCLALGISGKHNGLRLQRAPLTIRTGTAVRDDEVLVTPRIGITKADDWPLRWALAGSAYVSRRSAGYGSGNPAQSSGP